MHLLFFMRPHMPTQLSLLRRLNSSYNNLVWLMFTEILFIIRCEFGRSRCDTHVKCILHVINHGEFTRCFTDTHLERRIIEDSWENWVDKRILRNNLEALIIKSISGNNFLTFFIHVKDGYHTKSNTEDESNAPSIFKKLFHTLCFYWLVIIFYLTLLIYLFYYKCQALQIFKKAAN